MFPSWDLEGESPYGARACTNEEVSNTAKRRAQVRVLLMDKSPGFPWWDSERTFSGRAENYRLVRVVLSWMACLGGLFVYKIYLHRHAPLTTARSGQNRTEGSLTCHSARGQR